MHCGAQTAHWLIRQLLLLLLVGAKQRELFPRRRCVFGKKSATVAAGGRLGEDRAADDEAAPALAYPLFLASPSCRLHFPSRYLVLTQLPTEAH